MFWAVRFWMITVSQSAVKPFFGPVKSTVTSSGTYPGSSYLPPGGRTFSPTAKHAGLL